MASSEAEAAAAPPQKSSPPSPSHSWHSDRAIHTRLLYVNLSRNSLTGSIPSSFGKLASLASLNLSWNSLTGSIRPSLRDCSSLLDLILEHNQLNGSIPDSLYHLSSMRSLRLGDNEGISQDLGSASELVVLSLQGNLLTGPIPSSIGALNQLQVLNLSDNFLSGNIPPQLGECTALQVLDLQLNALVGAIPSEFGRLSSLQALSLLIKVTNNAAPSISIHWHGMYQNRTGWSDGPSYVTQCPIQTGNSFTYNFTVTGQRRTLWWHAHTSTLIATAYGAFIIRPIARYPFRNLQGQIRGEKTIILGQWWNSDVVAVINEALATGRGPNVSDAFTINGLPGPFYGDCSNSDTASIDVTSGGTYLLRIIKAANLFFGVADHNLIVVEADASYVKPFNTSSIVISPGQTLSVLLTASTVTGSYYMAAHVYTSAARFDNSTTAATLEVGDSTSGTSQSRLPVLPDFSDMPFVTDFNSKRRSLSTAGIPVPTKIDKEMVITVGLNLQDCPQGAPTNSCQGFGCGRLAASMNNISFVLPSTPSLQAYYNRASSGVYSTDFPAFPAEYDYSGTPLQNLNAIKGTQVHVVSYGANVQVVGSGFGNYNSSLASTFNLDDPPARNSIQVPAGGWTQG